MKAALSSACGQREPARFAEQALGATCGLIVFRYTTAPIAGEAGMGGQSFPEGERHHRRSDQRLNTAFDDCHDNVVSLPNEPHHANSWTRQTT